MNTRSDSAARTIVPVVLANRDLQSLWPWSVPGRPFAFQSPADGRAPVAELIDAIARCDGYERPWLVVSPHMLPAANEILGSRGKSAVRIMTVPANVRSGVPAVLAALQTAHESRNSILAFLPATLAIDGDAHRYLKRIATENAAAVENGYTVIAARRAEPGDDGILFQAGASKPDTGFREVERCLFADNPDAIEAACDQRAAWIATGPVITMAGRLLEMTSTLNAMLLQACQNALKAGDISASVVYPEQNFLSLVPNQSVGRILAGHARSVLLDPAGNTLRVVRSWADLRPAELERYQCGVSVRSAGLGNHGVIAGPGGAFVYAHGHDGEAAQHYGSAPQERDSPVLTAEPTYEHEPRRRPWGSEDIVEMQLGLAILRLEIDAGCALERECHIHRSESWVVSGGRGVATIDGRECVLKAGDHIALGRGAIHSVRNTGGEPLIIYETRTGAILDGDDRIAFAAEVANTNGIAEPVYASAAE